MGQKIWTSIAGAVGMLLLILDTRTAFNGAKDAIELCLRTVIPSLLPFFVFSTLLTSGLTGMNLRILKPFGALLRIPKGAEPIFLVGALGGYPTGAHAVADGFTSGQISKQDARRMLGFCSNAGPSFLFGIAGLCFTSPERPWILWSIHLLSALLTGMLLPGGSRNVTTLSRNKAVTLPAALKRSLQTTAQVCGWIVIFRVLLAFLQRWFLWLFPPIHQILTHGFLELTIGCLSLVLMESEGLRFILCAGFLAFGGLCITMQTMSVTAPVGMGMYLPGKLLQMLISILLAAVYQQFAFSGDAICHANLAFYLFLMAIGGILLLFLKKREKSCSNYALNRV